MSEVQQEASPATAALLCVLTQGDAQPAQLERAEDVFQEVLQQESEDPRFLFALASLRLKQDRIAEAEVLLRRLTESHPEHVTAWNNLAAILSDDPARLAEALSCIDRAIAAAGRPIANLLDTKAVILLQQNRNQEANALLQQVLSLADGRDSRFHLHYAVAQHRLGEAKAAKLGFVVVRLAWRSPRDVVTGENSRPMSPVRLRSASFSIENPLSLRHSLTIPRASDIICEAWSICVRVISASGNGKKRSSK